VSVSEPPIGTEVGQDLYDAVEPLTWADESVGWPLAIYLDCCATILDEIATLVRTDDDGNDGWSAFADPVRCPASFLFTLAQWAGVRYPRRMAEADLRALIGPHGPGMWRGTKAAILAAVERYLSPGGQLYFEERADGDAYKLRIFTYTYDTLDEASIRRELLAVVPAGLILDFEVRDGQTYGMVRDSGQTYAEVLAKYGTYDVLLNSLPEEAQ
jgi:hypothetical protein